MTIENIAQLKAKPWTTDELASMGITVTNPSAPASSSKSSSSLGSDSSSSSSGSASSVADGSGASGAKAVVTTATDMSLDPIGEWKTPEIASLENQKKEFAAADKLFGSAEEMLSGLREKNKDWLAGKISADVAEGLRSKSALAARSGGAAGSQASRNLQARDFGVTSMQLQESGMQREAQLAELSKGLGSIREQRAQYFANLQETSKQFGANLVDQMTRTQLAHKELMFKQDAFNAEQNARIVELISESTLGMMQLQVSAASADVDFGGNLSTWEKLQSQLSGLLSRSNAATK